MYLIPLTLYAHLLGPLPRVPVSLRSLGTHQPLEPNSSTSPCGTFSLHHPSTQQSGSSHRLMGASPPVHTPLQEGDFSVFMKNNFSETLNMQFCVHARTHAHTRTNIYTCMHACFLTAHRQMLCLVPRQSVPKLEDKVWHIVGAQ